MSSHFEATSDFSKSILSIDTLVDFAKQEGERNNGENRILFLKLAVVSMVTKFQVFIEKVLEEFLFEFKGSKRRNRDIPLYMRVNSLKLIALDYNLTDRLKNIVQYDGEKFQELKKHIDVIYDLCDDGKEINEDFILDCNFPIGKTGTGELIALFKQLEGRNVFECAGIDLEKLNGIFHLRHNIVHQDANPQLTETTVEEYRKYLDRIAVFIDEHLHNFGKVHS